MAVRQLLLKLLGEKRYLGLLAGTFQRLYRTGLLGREYEDVYFLKKIIRPGDYCLDIGAHLGYFTLELSRLTGPEGRVYAVEPMPLFHDTLQRLVKNKRASNVTVYRVALGGNGDTVEMGIPQVGSQRRFAHARIKERNDHLHFVRSVTVKNESGDDLFLQLPRLDYIKCDVEGFEYEVFASMPGILEKHRPMLLCELFERGLLVRFAGLLEPFAYRPYLLKEGVLEAVNVHAEGQIASDNYYFLAPRHVSRLGALIAGRSSP